MEKSAVKESKSSSEVDVEKLFHTRRLPRLPWALLLIFYTPFGLFLTFLRICMSFQVMLFLAIFPAGAVKRFILRVFFGVLGIVVITDSFHRKSSQTKVYVSNRVSWFDHIVFHLSLDCFTISSGGVAPLLHFFFPHRKLVSRSPEDLETEAKKMPEFDESRSMENVAPFVIQPEPLPTNGSHSLFQFSDWPCCLADNVQPIALTALRPFDIKITTVYSSKWWDLFWTLFVPTTVFRVKLLAPMEKREGEDGGKLSQRLQEAIREELKLQQSQVTMDNVTEWLKASRKRPSPRVSPSPRTNTNTTTSQSPASPPPSSSEPTTEMDRRVEQVSAVLPQVPHTTIRSDLLRTGSVDATITNLLEGVVTYDPIPPPTKQAPKPPSSYFTSSPPTFKSTDLRPRKHYSPAMEAMHRQLSLEERKRELVLKARLRYIEKHGLNVNDL